MIFSSLLKLFNLHKKQSFSKPKERGCDDYGCGHYGAPRGSRTHKGIDFEASPGEYVRAFKGGEVTKLGYPYADDLSYRYVQISRYGVDMRYFYATPYVELGQTVQEGHCLGVSQNIAGRYQEAGKVMKNHFHYEVKVNGNYVNPRKHT